MCSYIAGIRVAVICCLLCPCAVAEHRVIPLYDGPAPGSESWTQQESENTDNLWNVRIVFNVTDPTLTMYAPKDPNGTALIICPGGGFHALSIDNEGNDVARWLTEKGVTCFVLKYRLVECKTDDPTREMLTKGNSFREVVGATVKLAMNDGLTAIGYVRKHAKKLGVNPNRIGMIGFSAGGTLAASVAHNYTANTRPNYVAPIYLQYDWVIKGKVPSDAPPMFITAATDDQLRLADHSVRLYRDWTAAGKSAELHLFAKGGHGFGMRKQDLPTDRWIERFSDWMEVQGLLEDAQNVNVKGKQKEMSTEIPVDIQQRVVRDFGQQHADDIGRYLLERIPSGLPNGTRPRHLRCILYLAKGDREQLDRYIEMCLRDTRDVMLGAEYETTGDSKLVRKRDFNKPFDKAQLD